LLIAGLLNTQTGQMFFPGRHPISVVASAQSLLHLGHKASLR
jgi:ABC-type transport system involved in cytochrome c biogenesis ATPase subunit